MLPTLPPTDPDEEPLLDSPNRMEVDPADVSPAVRDADPLESWRTVIPLGIDPADMAPQAKIPEADSKGEGEPSQDTEE